MAKKWLIFALVLGLLAIPVAAEIEVGFGIGPSLAQTNDGSGNEAGYHGFFYDNTAVFHAGYSFAWLFYVSYDAMMLPPAAVAGMTGYFDVMTGTYQSGVYRPGMLSLIDFGIRPQIGPLYLLAEAGINNLYVYKQEELVAEGSGPNADFGVNLRAGLGWKVAKILSIAAIGSVAFPDFGTMVGTLEALGDDNLKDMALVSIMSNLQPSITLNLHL